MSKLMALLMGLMGFFGPGHPVENGTAKKDENRSLLWKITGRDMKHPSYLFGTMHLLCPADYIWTPAMNKSLKACREVCFEMDMDDPKVMVEIASGMIDNSGRKLKEYFSPEDYRIVEKFVTDSLGMSMMFLQQMKPAALQTLFATKAVSCGHPVSYETRIMEEAQKQKKEITGLEDAAEQLALLDSLPADSVTRELVAMARDYSKERNEFNRMLEAYRHQDLPRLHQIIEESRISGGNLDAFLGTRNRKWIERMEGKMDQQPVFFAVGAGHLPGEDGLIQLLRNQGYQVEPVR